jgi:release factor glutamine methyltransferase
MTTTIADALAAQGLPRAELRLLLMHLLPDLTHARIVAHPELELEQDIYTRFCSLLARRQAGEPIAYLLGAREFFGRPFMVGPAVLIPRPETEHLVEAALQRQGLASAAVLDLGCGSGAISVTLALEAPAWQLTAVDLSSDALAVARRNAQLLGASVDFYQGSWFDPLPLDARFNLIVSNPPYIASDDHHLDEGDVRFEPRMALTDGADGLECLRLIACAAPGRLLADGWLMVEHGYDQGPAVRALFAAQGLSRVETLRDLAGQERVTLGQKA